MNGLSPQRELFAQEVAKHGNQAQAYRVAYPKSEKWPQDAVYSKASNLMKDGKVMTRVAQLRSVAEQKLGMSRERWLARLSDLSGEHKPDDVALRALEQIGKALGYYAPQRLEIDHRQEVRVIAIEQRIAAVLQAREQRRAVESSQKPQEIAP